MVTVAISGLHGTGKTTAAKALSKEFDLRYISAGDVFRQMAEERDMSLSEFSNYVEDHPEIDKEIDQRTAEEAKKDGVLVDARLAGWMAKEADIRILLTASLEERVKRISDREDRSYDEVMEETRAREKSEERRYKDIYDIDVEDCSVFDLVLNTEKFGEEEMIRVLKLVVELVSE